MRRGRVEAVFTTGAILLAAVAAAAGGVRLPRVAGREAVASVNGEPITLDELFRQIGALHEGVTEPGSRARRPDPAALLERLINARLILQEARTIGLDRLPEVTSRIEALRVELVKSTLVERQVRGVTEGDPKVAERLYRDAVRELKIDSVRFEKEDDARAFAAAAGAGGDFGALAGEAIAAGRGKGGGDVRYVKAAELRPEAAAALAAMKPGQVSAPLRLGGEVAVVQLLDVRHPEDPVARRTAREAALEIRRQAALHEYADELRRRYTQVDRSVLDGLDYEAASTGLEALRGDGRVVAVVKGAEPVTVKDLTERVEKKFYHGVKGAIERKRVNEEIEAILDRLLMERVTGLEARRVGIERSDDFRDAMRERVDGLLFGAFMTKVINPEIRMEEAELRTYYDARIGEYSSPGMMRIEGLAFARREDAEPALDRLRRGADLKWMRANAGGQADREQYESLLEFNGALLATTTLPEGIRKALAGAAAGDCRFSGEPGGPFYVLCVRQMIAPAPTPYEEVRGDIARSVSGLKRQAAVEGWTARLRAASKVKIFATDAMLDEILGLRAANGS